MSVPETVGKSYKRRIKLDFSADLNPLGMPEGSKRAVSEMSCFEVYPDPDCTELRKKIAAYEKVPMENIVCGSGEEDLIYRIVQGLCPKKALVCAPTFSEYKRALLENGCDVKEYMLSKENNFGLTTEFADHITPGTDIVFLCSPNDPTGEIITPYTLGTISEKCRRNNTILVCDESFMELVPKNERFSGKGLPGVHIIVIKGFTKAYAMAGLRLGYAIFAADRIAEIVRDTGKRCNVSGPAQAAGKAALEDEVYLKRSRRVISDERRYLSEELTRMGIMVYPSQADFLLIRCELPLDKLLIKRGILIRSCSDLTGLENGYFRIAVRTHSDNKRLVAEMEKILHD